MIKSGKTRKKAQIQWQLVVLILVLSLLVITLVILASMKGHMNDAIDFLSKIF